jgi:hypothetical protein
VAFFIGFFLHSLAFFSFDLSREVVSVSLDLFDRYLATRGNQCNGNLALLTSLTTLHIAIKLHDTKKIKIATLANLSRGQFGAKHIEEMEWKILFALGWQLHPPTQYAFVSHLLLLLPSEVHPAVRKEIFELSRYLTELSICDSYFVDVNNSTVAFAAILNVMDDLSYARLSAGLREKYLRDLTQVGLVHHSPLVIAARERLRTMFVATNNVQPVSGVPPSSSTNKSSQDSSDCGSLASSVGSKGSYTSSNRLSRSNSVDSKGSCRYSPSPTTHRRFVIANASPISSSRATHMSVSPIMAGSV